MIRVVIPKRLKRLVRSTPIQDTLFLISYIYHKALTKKPVIMPNRVWYESWKYGCRLFTGCEELLILGDWFYYCQFTGLLKGESLLNVGITPTSGELWLKFFKYDLGFERVSSIEIWTPNIRRLKLIGHRFPIENCDVRYLHRRYPPNSIDVILWAQGPEHIDQIELKATIQNLLMISKIALIMFSPYGSLYDDKDVDENPYEEHRIKAMEPAIFRGLNLGLEIFTWGVKNSLGAGLCAYKFKGV